MTSNYTSVQTATAGRLLFAGIQRRVFNGVYGFSDLFLGPIPNRNRQSLCVAAKLAAEHLLERNLKTQRGYR